MKKANFERALKNIRRYYTQCPLCDSKNIRQQIMIQRDLINSQTSCEDCKMFCSEMLFLKDERAKEFRDMLIKLNGGKQEVMA